MSIISARAPMPSRIRCVLDNPTTAIDPDGHTNGPGHDETPPNGCGGANQPACQQSSAQVAADQTNDPPAQQKKADQAPSRDPSKPLPDNPSKLGPDWKRDPGHKAPNEERYVNDKTGDKLDWNKGKPSGGKRWRDNPHWHWVPGGEKQKGYYEPGDTVKRVGFWTAAGAAAAGVGRAIITAGEACVESGLCEAIP